MSTDLFFITKMFLVTFKYGRGEATYQALQVRILVSQSRPVSDLAVSRRVLSILMHHSMGSLTAYLIIVVISSLLAGSLPSLRLVKLHAMVGRSG